MIASHIKSGTNLKSGGRENRELDSDGERGKYRSDLSRVTIILVLGVKRNDKSKSNKQKTNSNFHNLRNIKGKIMLGKGERLKVNVLSV